MNIVTGAFGYIGKYIARHLLEQGEAVRTITTHPDKPNPFGEAVQAFPSQLRPAGPAHRQSARRIDTVQHLLDPLPLWRRYLRAGCAEYGHAIQVRKGSRCWKNCPHQRDAGLEESDLPYYRGKAQQEQALIDSGVPYSIVRPTLVFGKEDILVNNIGWLIRKFPVFPIFGSGQYKVQPVFVEDLARIVVASARESENVTLDAIGPETFTYEELVRRIAARIKPGVRLIHISPSLGILLGQLIGIGLGDVVLTRDELNGLMDELLTSRQVPNGTTRFSDWLESNADELGSRYSSEIKRHFKWRRAA